MDLTTLARAGLPILLVGALAACSSNTADKGGSAPARGGGACKIALLLPENTTPRYEAADKPYFEATVRSKAPNCEVLYFNAANDGSKQAQQAETALTQGANVLVLGAADAASAGTIVDEAKAKGVPTIDYDRLSGGPVAYLVSFDAIQVGELQGRALVDAMKRAGDPAGSKIVMINGDTSGAQAKLFKQGARSVIEQSGFTVGAEYDTTGWSPDTATTEMGQAITKVGKDKIKGVYVANDTMSGAAINAMQQAGMSPLPPVTGQDAATDGLQRVLLGTQTMTVYKALKREAADAAVAAIALASGQQKPTATATQTNSAGTAIPADLLTPVAVTADNIKTTVIADGFVTAAALCSGAVKAACAKRGIG
jgi:D-xylose transport system substrate-binding protein